MKLSLKVIIECLAPYQAHLVETQTKDFEFTGVQILTSPTEELQTDTLYICSPKVLPKMKRQLFEDHCFVFKARPQQLQCRHELHGIVLSEDADLNEVVNVLITLFTQFNRFEFAVKEAALSRRGYEPFFDVARQAFPHCLILVTDSAYNIMAATRKSVEDKPYFNNLLHRGFYSQEEMDQIAGHGYYDDERKCIKPVLYQADKTYCGYPFLVRSYKNNGAAYCFMGCYFLDAPPTERDVALYTCLTDELDTYFRVNGIYESGMLSTQQQLIDDLVRPKQNTAEYFRDRCAKLGIPYHGSLRLGLVLSDTDTAFKLSLIANRLRAHCPLANFGAFLYGSAVVVVFRDWNNSDVKIQATFHEDWNALMTTLQQCKAYMGVSLLFSEAAKFGVAYRQALAAVTHGRKRGTEGEAFFYSKYYLEDILQHYSEVMPLEDTYTHYIDRLMDNNGGACSNVKLLYYYLCSERNISLTAKHVHMHRNSVIYRIQKLQDTLALNLDDPDVRLRLMISLKILEMTGRIPVWEPPHGENESADGTDIVRIE